MAMFRWIFFDVGNILLDEDPLTFLSFRRHAEAVQRVRPEYGFLDLLEEREARVSAGSRWPVYEAVSAHLDDRQCAAVWEQTAQEVRTRFAELSPLIPGAAELVERLSARFHLGLIANQGSECRARLAALGLLDRFQVVAFSEEQGFSKPDPRLFLHALHESGAEAEQCLMVGDRLDNDHVPASSLGLATCWVRWPVRAAKGWQPDDPEALAYIRSLERTSFLANLNLSFPQPTFLCDEIRQLAISVQDCDIWC